jgi:hypothetical protein
MYVLQVFFISVIVSFSTGFNGTRVTSGSHFFLKFKHMSFLTPCVFLGLIRLIDSVHDSSFIRLG